MVDPTGHFFNLLLGAIGAAAGAAAGVVVNCISNVTSGKDFFDNWGAAAAGGAITGLAAGVTCGGSLAAQAAVSAGAYGLSSMAGNAVQQGMTKGFDKIDAGEVNKAGVIGAVMGGASKAVSGSYVKPQVKPNEYAGSSSVPNKAARSVVEGASKAAEGAGKGAKTTLDYLKGVEKINGSYYAPKNVIDDIGKIEARGIDFSKLNSSVMSSRASTEGGLSRVIRYSDSGGTRFIIHEVNDNVGNLLHRDFDAVRIQSGQLINKLSK